MSDLHLSKLVLNPRSRAARRDLASSYALHQTLLCAFDRNGDTDGQGKIRAGRLLFRLEPSRGPAPPTVIIQAESEADWDNLSIKADDYFAPSHSPQQKTISLDFEPGWRLRFRLRANPVRTRPMPPGPDGKRPRGKRSGVVGEDKQAAWLTERLEKLGAHVLDCLVVDEGFLSIRQSQGQSPIRVQSMLAEGHLRVTDPARLSEALCQGIGPAKGLGFGLLSLGPPS